MGRPITYRTPEDILANCIPEPNSGCWLWLGAPVGGGYGTIRVPGTRARTMVHRRLYEMIHGVLPAKIVVRHKCDNSACCWPGHLTHGTTKENRQDAMERGRAFHAKPGEAHHLAKLTDEDVRLIRADARLQREIAAQYGVSRQCVGGIKTRRNWAHVE